MPGAKTTVVNALLSPSGAVHTAGTARQQPVTIRPARGEVVREGRSPGEDSEEQQQYSDEQLIVKTAPAHDSSVVTWLLSSCPAQESLCCREQPL